MTQRVLVSIASVLLLCGAATADVVRVPRDHASIQAAIDAASSGDTVLVDPGTYYERLDFGGKTIRLESTMGAEQTILDGERSGSVITIENGEGYGTAVIGFTIQNGFIVNQAGAGIRCASSSIVEIRANVIRWNETFSGGGGILVSDAIAIIAGNRIRENLSYSGGGGIMLRGEAEVVANEIEANAAGGGGGGILCSFGDDSRIARNLIARNYATNGAGMFLLDATTCVERNLIEGNEAEDGGGGVFVDGRATIPKVQANTIRSNSARYGGGLCNNNSRWIVAGNLLYENFAFYASSLYQVDAESLLVWNTILDEPAEIDGSVLLTYYGTLYLANTIVWPAAQGGEVVASDEGAVDVRHCIVRGGIEGIAVIDEDPGFAARDRGDWRLRLDSVAVDRATLDVAFIPDFDLDGRDRLVGSPDIGAYEMHPEIAARYGTIEGGDGELHACLTINGESGDCERVVEVGRDESIELDVLTPPAGPSPARFALYAWLDEPDRTTLSPQPFGVGLMSFPTPLDPKPVNQPLAIWNNLGRKGRLGFPDRDSMPAPSQVFHLVRGLETTGSYTFQGFIEDQGSGADGPISITNAVVLRVVE